MVERFLRQTKFSSYEDFMQNFKVEVPENFNFGYDVVDEWARIAPQKEAILWTNDQGGILHVNYAQYKEKSDQVAAYLRSLGIDKGDRVMLILKRRIEWWYCMVALCKIGAIVIPATHLLTGYDVAYRCNSAGIRAIIACGDSLVMKHINDAMPTSPSLQYRISIGPEYAEGWLNFWKGVNAAPKFERPEYVNKNSDSMLMYFTSGTVGEPKMVVHDFTYPLGHIITGIWHNLDETSLHLTLADTGWGKAVWGKFYAQMIFGATIFVYDFDGKFEADKLLQVIQDYKITSFCAPPTVFRFMIREDLSKYDLSHLRYCTIAGEALNPTVYQQWEQLTGIQLREGYGQTETTLSIATYPWVTPRPGSMGVEGPQYKVDVLNDRGESCKPGENGQLVIRTDKGKPLGLFKEYFHNPVITELAHRNGIYYTGDVVNRDEDGYFWFVGRADDVIKSSGYRIGPFEVESACMTHPAVMECAITGVPDPVRGQVVKATIVLAPSYRDKAGDALAKEIQNHVKRVTAPYKYPRVIEFVDELPKTISGKVRHVEIRQKDASPAKDLPRL
jgi:acetyl-CoA synthetase